ncbi:hypothetical protein H257_00479 [Aphanomyces astaci]|uniref:BTB domain-containing protein n=1 Tax=Aphanomyces astaci TaxID=112090 RepID=W4HB04_APHAT|nr:hypothetical protein H257_00479 [Aphanomyces astaci]ETV89102.1 hypothetical protein H257_00479 [Aphanomyces astaci]|eukprot:XP_009821502.1 hypothetical protein H257_00479 [Aphanomyces astaci]
MAEWAELERRIQENLANAPNIVTLDVGGTIFKTSKANLLRVEGSYFHALLGSGQWKPDSPDDAYFLDLDPHLFCRVLIFLRTGKLSASDFTDFERGQFDSMLEYLKLNEVGAPQFQWDSKALVPGLTLSNDFRTIERLSSHDGNSTAAVVKRPLVEGRQCRIRVDACHGDNFCIGLATISGCNVSPFSRSNLTYRCNGNGYIYKKQTSTRALRQIEDGDVLTIRRGPMHVEFELNDGPPQYKVELMDPFEELFAVVLLYRKGTKMTILD